MAKKYNGTINFASALRPTGAQPLDDRMVVQSLTDLMSFATFEAEGASAAYNGMMVAVLEEQKVFMLINAAQLNTEDAWVSVGSGNGSLSVDTLAEAKALATNDNRGQIIFVISENATYVVTGAENVMKLAASTAESIDEVVNALQSRVKAVEDAIGTKTVEGEEGKEATGLYKEIEDLKDAVEAIEVPVQDVKFNGESVLENGVATITVDLTPYETVANVDKVREDVAANTKAIEDIDAAVKAIEVPVQDVKFNGESVLENGVAAITVDLTPYAKTAAVNAELAKKVDIVEGKRLMTDAEGTKLAGIAEGAQVNVIETVKVNGTALEVTEKSVNVVIEAPKVKGVDGADKMLSLTEGGEVKSELSIVYVEAEGENPPYIALYGKGGTQLISSIDATKFVKDGMIDTVELVDTVNGGKALKITWNTSAGKEVVELNVSDLIDYYYAGDGISFNEETRKFSVDLKEGERFLVVDAAGLGVDESALWGAADDKYDAKGEAAKAQTAAATYTDETIEALKLDETYEAKGEAAKAQTAAATYTDEAIEALDLANTYEAKGTAQGIVDDLNLDTTYEKVGVAAGLLKAHEDAMEEVLAGKANVGDSYTKAQAEDKFVAQVEGERLMTDAEGTKLAGIAEGAQVNVIEAIKVNGVDATVAEGGKLAEVTVDGTKVFVGADIQGDVKNPETGEVSKETVYGSTTTLAAVLQGIQDSVSVAVSGGLTSVVAGNGVEVSAVASNKQTVSVKVSNAEGNMITADENGIYAAMYYDGDDAE